MKNREKINYRFMSDCLSFKEVEEKTERDEENKGIRQEFKELVKFEKKILLNK